MNFLTWRGRWSRRLLTSECANREIWHGLIVSDLFEPISLFFSDGLTGSRAHGHCTHPSPPPLIKVGAAPSVWHHRLHHEPPRRHAFSDSSAFYFPSALFPRYQFGQSVFDNVRQMHLELKVGGLGEKQNGLEYVKSAFLEDPEKSRNGGSLVRD